MSGTQLAWLETVPALVLCELAGASDTSSSVVPRLGEAVAVSVAVNGGVLLDSLASSYCLTRVECAMCTFVIPPVLFCLSSRVSGFGTLQLSHSFTGMQPQALVASTSFSVSESGLGEKYADEDDGWDVRESERGGLGRSPKVSKLECKRLWSERHVRNG